jgi:long-chain acyl-CoA synthetase
VSGLNTDSSPRSLTARAEHLAAYKRPRLVRFVDQLPTTSTGKIMRWELITRFHR